MAIDSGKVPLERALSKLGAASRSQTREWVLKGRLQVNGQTKQSSDLDKLIWDIPELLADLSQFYHLQAGDLIMTGTPEGVGPVHVGDRITGHIDQVGDIELTIGAAE